MIGYMVTLPNEKKAQSKETMTQPVKKFLENWYAVPYKLKTLSVIVPSVLQVIVVVVPQWPNDEKCQEQENSDRAGDVGRFPQSLRVVIRIFESDIFVGTINVCQADSTKSIPGVMSIVEYGHCNGHNRSCSDASDTAIQTWISLPNRCDVHSAGESFGKCELV